MNLKQRYLEWRCTAKKVSESQARAHPLSDAVAVFTVFFCSYIQPSHLLPSSPDYSSLYDTRVRSRPIYTLSSLPTVASPSAPLFLVHTSVRRSYIRCTFAYREPRSARYFSTVQRPIRILPYSNQSPGPDHQPGSPKTCPS